MPLIESRKVYLLCSRRPIVGEFVLLAGEMVSTSDLTPVFVVAEGLKESLIAQIPADTEVIATGAQSWRNAGRIAFGAYLLFAVLRRLGAALRTLRLELFADFIATWEALARGRVFAKHVLRLDSDNCIAILTADDRDIRFDQGMLRAARDRKIFSMSVAFGKSDPDTDAMRRTNREYAVDSGPWSFLKLRIARDYPANVRATSSGNRVFFLKPAEYLALRAHDVLFPVPWSYGGGTADKVSLIDKDGQVMLRSLGVPASKVMVAGQCSHDILWLLRERRDAIRKTLDIEHDLDPARPLLVLALPVLGEHGMASMEQQIEDTSLLFQAMVKVAGKNVLVSLHPRQKPADYMALANCHGVKLTALPLRDVLPAADLFVAYSSTINWAQLLCIPSVALEYFNLGYALFANQPGVLIASSRDMLADVCATAINPGDTRSACLAALASFSTEMHFDGQVRRRIINEIKSHSQKGPVCVSSV